MPICSPHIPSSARDYEVVDYTHAKIRFPPSVNESNIKALEQPDIFENQVHFAWLDKIVEVTITPYHLPPININEDYRELQHDFKDHPIVKKRVIEPAKHNTLVDLAGICSLLQEFEKLIEAGVVRPELTYTKEPHPKEIFRHVYRVNDSTSLQDGLLKKVLRYKGVSKQIVPGREDLVDIAEHLEMVDGKTYACSKGESLKEAFKTALQVYEMRERLE